MDVIGGGIGGRRRLLPAVRVQRRRLRAPQVCRAAVAHQGALALRVGGQLLFHLDVRAREVLVAAHVELEAEVTGGGEGAEFALERLAAVLVLMYLEKGDSFNVTLRLLTTPSFFFFFVFRALPIRLPAEFSSICTQNKLLETPLMLIDAEKRGGGFSRFISTAMTLAVIKVKQLSLRLLYYSEHSVCTTSGRMIPLS